MPWIRLECDYFENDKIRRAGALAAVVHLQAIAYCFKHKTNGFVDDKAMEAILEGTARLFGVGYHGRGKRKIRDALARLASEPPPCPTREQKRPLLHRAEGGFIVNDYLTYQPPAAARKAATLVRTGSQRAGGTKRAATAERDERGRFRENPDLWKPDPRHARGAGNRAITSGNEPSNTGITPGNRCGNTPTGENEYSGE